MKATLDALPQGSFAVIHALHVSEAMHKRLMDFGLIEGTEIQCLRNEKGLSLYKVRGTMIALRNADTAMICVELCD